MDIRKGEGTAMAAAFLSLFGITASHMLSETARDALFLANLPSERLPIVYIAIAFAGVGLSTLNRRRLRSGKRKSAIVPALVISAATTAAFWAVVHPDRPWSLYLLYIWTGVYAGWVVVELWTLVGGLFTVVQAKRLFGPIGSGSALGAFSGALLARTMSSWTAPNAMLLAASILLGLTGLGPAVFLTRLGQRASESSISGRRSKETKAFSFRAIAKQPYASGLFLLLFLSSITVTVVDYIFKSQVAAEVPPDELGAYFASIYTVLNALSLILQIFVVATLMRVFGVHRSVLVLPLFILLGSVGVILGGGLFAALAIKGTDGALRYSLHRTSAELLYVPVSEALKARIKPFFDLVGQRGGQALASIVILGAVSIGMGSNGLGVMAAVLAGAWLVIAARLKKPYLQLFRETLSEGRVDDRAVLPELDLDALETVFAALNSHKDPEVLCALELLAAQQRHRLIPTLLLYHPSKEVVERALDLMTEDGRTDFLPVARRLLSHADVEIRTAALRAIGKASSDEADEVLEEEHQSEVMEVALTAAIVYAGSGRRKLEDIRDELDHGLKGSQEVRIAIARAIAYFPSDVFDNLLLQLLKSSPESDARVEVALAMGRVGSACFHEVLLPLIPFGEVGDAARRALAEMGPSALNFLSQAIADDRWPRGIRWRIPRALVDFEPELVVPVLLKHLESTSDGMLRYRIIRALRALQNRREDLPLDATVLERVAETLLEEAHQFLAWSQIAGAHLEQHPKGKTTALELMTVLFRDKERHATDRLIRLLGLMNPDENFERIRRGLHSPSAKTRASSRELLENVMTPSLRQPVLNLLDDLPAAHRLERAKLVYRKEKRAWPTLVVELAARNDELGRLAAIHAHQTGVTVSTTRDLEPEPSPLLTGLASLAHRLAEEPT